jgi:flagellar protein FlaG
MACCSKGDHDMEITPVHQNTGGAAQSVGSQAGSGNLRPSGGVSPLAPQQPEAVPVQFLNSTEAQVEQATEVANRFMDSLSLNLQFSMDKDVNKVVVKVVDRDTHEVIKQFPSEEMLAIAKALDKLQGLLIKTHA